jgi:DNA-binding XRE family transcriptional regulator
METPYETPEVDAESRSVSSNGWRAGCLCALEGYKISVMKTVEILPKRKKRDLLSATGETLRGVRKERGLTLRQVAEGAHVSVSYLAEIERGEKDPSSRILESIAGGLDIEMSGLLIRIAEALEPARATSKLAA